MNPATNQKKRIKCKIRDEMTYPNSSALPQTKREMENMSLAQKGRYGKLVEDKNAEATSWRSFFRKQFAQTIKNIHVPTLVFLQQRSPCDPSARPHPVSTNTAETKNVSPAPPPVAGFRNPGVAFRHRHDPAPFF